jgi:hypothetical protein
VKRLAPLVAKRRILPEQSIPALRQWSTYPSDPACEAAVREALSALGAPVEPK